MPIFEDLRVFSGNSHPKLTKDICDYLDISVGECDVFKFSNDNTFVSFKENIRERDVFLVQSFSSPVNDHIMELLVMIDAAKRASAGRITTVIPYFAYGRTDKKDQPRVPITARLIADLISTAGADRVLTIDLHAAQIQGFFNIPVDELTAIPILTRYIKEKNIDYLSIDLEGIDFEILMSLNLNDYNIKNISFEYLHLNKKQKKQLVNYLLKYGYSYCGFGYDINNFDFLFKKKKILLNRFISRFLWIVGKKHLKILNLNLINTAFAPS